MTISPSGSRKSGHLARRIDRQKGRLFLLGSFQRQYQFKAVGRAGFGQRGTLALEGARSQIAVKGVAHKLTSLFSSGRAKEKASASKASRALRFSPNHALARVELQTPIRMRFSSAPRTAHPPAWACAAAWRTQLLADFQIVRRVAFQRFWKLPSPAPSRARLGASS